MVFAAQIYAYVQIIGSAKLTCCILTFNLLSLKSNTRVFPHREVSYTGNMMCSFSLSWASLLFAANCAGGCKYIIGSHASMIHQNPACHMLYVGERFVLARVFFTARVNKKKIVGLDNNMAIRVSCIPFDVDFL